MTSVPKSAFERARKLRANATSGEKRLWFELKAFRKRYGLAVRRQVPIGPYVADFAIRSKKLVIEIDGEFHFTRSGIEKDRVRDRWLEQRGYRVLHVTTGALIDDFESCINSILHELGLMT